MLLVEPVVIRPLLVEWEAEKTTIATELERAEAAKSRAARTKRRNEAEQRYRAFLERLRRFTVLDPACGSGNFLYLALQPCSIAAYSASSRSTTAPSCSSSHGRPKYDVHSPSLHLLCSPA